MQMMKFCNSILIFHRHTGLGHHGTDNEPNKEEEEASSEDVDQLTSFSMQMVKKKSTKKKSDVAVSLYKMFPGLAAEHPSEASLENSVKTNEFVVRSVMLIIIDTSSPPKNSVYL